MRKSISISVLLSALLLAATVAGLHYGAWAFFNRPTGEAADFKGKVGGFAYAGFQPDQSPLTKTYPSDAELAADMDVLKQRSNRIRTYSSVENAATVDLAAERGMDVTAGAWISERLQQNETELATTIDIAKSHRNVSRVVVGNEVLLRGDIPIEQLEGYLDRARAALNKPVSTAEPWHVWLKNPELAKHVDYIAVHLLPYHEGVPAEIAVDFALSRYEQLVKTFPGKKIVIGEIGWPSDGPVLKQAVPSVDNQARFVRDFMVKAARRNLDYYLMEAIDQPWKVETEGWEGQYWGMYNANRQPKYELTGTVVTDVNWQQKGIIGSLLAFAPILVMALAVRRWRLGGKLLMAGMIQACITLFVVAFWLPESHYFTTAGLVTLGALMVAMLVTVTVVLSNGFEFTEAMFNGGWRRRFAPMSPLPSSHEPFVSLHLACYNEPPEMVIATIDSLARLDYTNYEVIIVDNNTKDEDLWKPVEAHCAALGSRFRFFHLPKWPGFKAGALNFALAQTDSRAQHIGVVDADYVVRRDWLASLIPHFADEKVAVVQAPQAHRDYENHWFRRMTNWEFDGFFRIGMHHRNERNALIQHGTMTLVRASALRSVGGWSEWCICEDSELGLRLLERGHELRYVDEVLGVGLTPDDFAGLKSQRFRWAFGAMQILKGHAGSLLGRSKLDAGQRYHFLTGWMSWFGDALQFVFTAGAIGWTVGMLMAPKIFTLPVAEIIVPVLGLLVAKSAMGPILYRKIMKCSWADIGGAALASLGLSHAIARGVFAGLTQRKGEFVRTPKGWKQDKGFFKALAAVREEFSMFAGLMVAAAGMLVQRGTGDGQALLWSGMLMLQTLPYVAALACQWIARMPERKAAQPKPVVVPMPVAQPAMVAAPVAPMPVPAMARAASVEPVALVTASTVVGRHRRVAARETESAA
ncbi:glycosyltransferase NdvB [soil metagenome]